MQKKILLPIFLLLNTFLFAQSTITGTVYDEYLEPFTNAVITTSKEQVISDSDGTFTLKTALAFPFTLQISAFGHKTETLEVTSADQEINVILKENIALDEVVISASRSPERVIESPVTIERIGITEIKRNTSVSFYDGLKNLKGIESREANYGFKSINSRGFSTFDNTRFVQLVDGVETSIPALNFSAGNIVGLSDLDVKDVEILPGASSALYGANAFNGILLMRSKSPFDYTGISTYFKTGFINQKATDAEQFYDVGIRMAYKFDEKLAAKANLTYFRAEEWNATSTVNTSGVGGEIISGNRESNHDYDGLNVYGDEFSFTLKQIAAAGGLPQSIINGLPNDAISRTGYEEKNLVDYNGNNLKFDASVHFRPWANDKLEIILNSRFSRGNNIYQGTNRFFQKDYFVQQYKLEFLGKNYFLRGYYTGNDSGKSHDLRFVGLALNELSKPTQVWYADYLGAFLSSGNHQVARQFADNNRLQPGSNEFKNAVQQIIETPIANGGAAIKDETSFYHADANYNFRDLIKWGEIQIGGSYRRHIVNSNGTLFTDKNSKITFDNYGFYSQIQKRFFENRLKFTGSVRYDKSKNFEGNFSPRIALNYSLGKNNDHVLRASYQTGFRNPSIIEQYFGLKTGPSSFNIGTADENLDRFITTVTNNNGSSSTLTGRDAFNNSFVAASVYNGRPQKANVSPIRPEKVTSYELGYRSIIGLTDDNILELDVNGYYNQYKDFVAFKNVIVPNYGKIDSNGQPDAQAVSALANRDFTEFTLNTNSLAEISSYGIGVGLSTKILKSFNVGLNYTLSRMIFDQDSDPNFSPGFNTPEHQVKFMFGNPNLFKNFGFNINAIWQNSFLWQSSFLNGTIDSRTVLDAQINYRIPAIKSRFKIGGTNLTGEEYYVAPGSGKIGSLYYISWTINN